jgi:glycosyltransferase involved in cell wall biosynthesis
VTVRALVFSQFFSPEVGATQARVHGFASALAARGHDVEVVCEVPNHPQGRVRPGYGGKAVERREVEGFRASYVWVYTAPRKTTATRLGLYASYLAMASAVGCTARRPDVVLASSPPLPVAIAGAASAARHRVPWVMDVRDLWPEAAIAMGELRDARLVRWTERLARGLYERADAITVVTEPFRDQISERVSRPGKIELVPNGASSLWLEGAQLEPERADLGIPEDLFLWTFAGNVGGAQGLEAAIDAAAILGDGYRLLVLGDGPARPALERRAASMPDRVEFRDQIAPEDALRYLRASDALLVSLSAAPELRPFVPSKLYDFCAVGRPVVLAAAGESVRLAGASDGALCVRPGSAEEIAAAVRGLRGDPGMAAWLARRGREFAAAHRREDQTERMADLLEAVVGRRVGADVRAPPPDVRSSGPEEQGK